MEAHEANLVSNLLKKDDVIFKIPVYQRPYCWLEDDHVETLLEDIQYLLENPKAEHFIGTIVYSDRNSRRSDLDRYIIVDGQQRITTMFLLFKALMDSLDPEADRNFIEKIDKSFLHVFEDEIREYGAEENKKKHIKLEMNSPDQEVLEDLLYFPDRINKKSHIWKNYDKIRYRIEDWLKDYSPKKIDSALKRLTYVYIALDWRDDAQKIFASLNSTGKALEPADNVRNLLLMNREDMEDLYHNYWLKIEELLLRQENDCKNLNDFLRHYLIFRHDRYINANRIYEEFEKMIDEVKDTKVILQDLYEAALIYNAFLLPEKSEYPLKVRDCLSWLRLIDVGTVYPLFLSIFRDYQNGIISSKELERIILVLVSYIIRRQICGLKTSNLNRFFSTFYKNAFKIEENKSLDYPAAIEQVLLNAAYTINNFPDDKAIRSALAESGIGNSIGLCKAVLAAIENSGNEHVVLDNMTIEHLMPQTMTPAWEAMVAVPENEYKPYLHNLGNLTLTAINSELSNRPFDEKKEILQRLSKAVVLNEDIFSAPVWNIPVIKQRLGRLTELVIKAFPQPEYNTERLLKEGVQIRLEDADDRITGGKALTLGFDNKEYPVKNFKQLYLMALRHLYHEDSESLEKLADSDYGPDNFSNRILITRDESKISKPVKLEDGIFVDASFSSRKLMNKLKQIQSETDSTTEFLIRYQQKNQETVAAPRFENFSFSPETYRLFEKLRERILELDADIKEDPKKLYIAYKYKTNFADVIPYKSLLSVIINMKFNEIADPENKCEDVSNIGSWGNGEVRFNISSEDDLDYLTGLIEQSLSRQKN